MLRLVLAAQQMFINKSSTAKHIKNCYLYQPSTGGINKQADYSETVFTFALIFFPNYLISIYLSFSQIHIIQKRGEGKLK